MRYRDVGGLSEHSAAEMPLARASRLRDYSTVYRLQAFTITHRGRTSKPRDSMKSLRFVLAICVAGVTGCALPMFGGGSSYATRTAQSLDTDVTAPPIVQVREFWRSATISVVAWDKDEAYFGLRTSVTRNGTLVGGDRFGDHRLYLTPLLVQNMGGFAHAAVMPTKEVLLAVGTQKDSYSCFYGKQCSPMVTLGVRIPDSLLRANRDSLVVTFFPRVREPWTITLRRELITAYLDKVDLVVADMTRTATNVR